jgi:predicted DCC family thiol-disulfide oxidoreductase YuxK
MNPEITFLHDGGGRPPRARGGDAAPSRSRPQASLPSTTSPRGFDAARYGATHAELMARIHGVLPDGTLVEGVEVFRRAYAAVGLGWLMAPTRWPLVRPLADAAYRWFARNRLRLTGRGEVCNAERCTVHASGTSDPAAASSADPPLHPAPTRLHARVFRTPS